MKAQMKSADRSGAKIALIIGSEEVESSTIMLRPMGSGEQYSIAREKCVGEIRKALENK